MTNSNQYIAILELEEYYKTSSWSENETTFVDQHFQKLLEMKDKGIVVFAGRTQYENSHKDLKGFVVFYAENLIEANKIMNEDPCVINNLMKVKVHPFKLAIVNIK